MRPLLEFLSSDEVYAIHQASLEILERVGVRFESPGAQQALKSAGVDVDFKGARVAENRRFQDDSRDGQKAWRCLVA